MNITSRIGRGSRNQGESEDFFFYSFLNISVSNQWEKRNSNEIMHISLDYGLDKNGIAELSKDTNSITEASVVIAEYNTMTTSDVFRRRLPGK